MSGTLVKTVGFEWMLFGIALLNFVYAPLLLMLKSPPTKEEKKVRWNIQDYSVWYSPFCNFNF